MASLQEDTKTVQREFDAISTPTQVFIATLVALGIVIGVLLGLWMAVDPQDDADPHQIIEWDDNIYRLDDGGAPPEEGEDG
jgi:hypothetical protein